MNGSPLAVRVSMDRQLRENSCAAPVQVLMDLHILSKEDYLKWRNKKTDCLERVCMGNLNHLAFILDEIRRYGKELQLKESVTYYRQWGKKNKAELQFTKTKNGVLERRYATHYIEIKGKDDE